MPVRKNEHFCKHKHDTVILGRDKYGSCRECGRIRHRIYYHTNTPSISQQNRKHKWLLRYNMSPIGYDELLKKQENKCAICCQPSVRTLHLDHDHKTGKIRGLLCYGCNLALGLMKDDPSILAAGIKYLNL